MKQVIAGVAILSLVSLQACDEGGASGAEPEQAYSTFFSPLPETSVYPADNPFTVAKRDLGEFLFWDPILSGRMNVACATCHHPDHGWADGRRRSVGVDGEGLGPARQGDDATEFNSPTILNVAFTGIAMGGTDPDFVSGPYFWDHRVRSLEEQALHPIKSEIEMRSRDYLEVEIVPEILNRLSLIDEYRVLFAAAFEGSEPISEINITKALATYQRSLISTRTRFDRFLEGDEAALSAREVTGLNKFINGGCSDCHSGPMLSDNQIDTDRPVLQDRPAVRTPALRDVARTSPYFQDGSSAGLGDAIALYEDRGDLGVTLEEEDVGDIEAFLNTLTSNAIPQETPVYVPSQLPVGGNIQ